MLLLLVSYSCILVLRLRGQLDSFVSLSSTLYQGLGGTWSVNSPF